MTDAPLFRQRLPCRLVSPSRDAAMADLTLTLDLLTVHSHQKQQAFHLTVTDEVRLALSS